MTETSFGFNEGSFTPYNVGSGLRRLFSTAKAVQYCGGIASVHVGEFYQRGQQNLFLACLTED